MLAKTALLIVSNPKQIGTILPSVQQQVKSTLYIQLISALSEPFGSFQASIFTPSRKFSQIVCGIYSQAATYCKNLDVRVLLSNLKYSKVNLIKTNRNIDLIIFDKDHNKAAVDTFIKERIGCLAQNYEVLTLESEEVEMETVSEHLDNVTYKHTVLGGTFDRLHLAHKLLLSEAAIRSNFEVTVGVTENNMLQSKLLWELIEPLEVRINSVKDFLTDIDPELIYNIVPISDPFGPAIVDPTMNMIVVSDETLKGGEKINEIRKTKTLNALDIIPVSLIEEPHRESNEESKISSSTCRMRLLGTLLKPPNVTALLKKPYIIGLTGGIASGKSGISKWLELRGAEIIDCDKVGHSVYLYGKHCYKKLVEEFGDKIVAENKEIDRKSLGAIVFNNPEQMDKLNKIVWPAILEDVQAIINRSKSLVIVVEAAVLLTAGWNNSCHEVWSTFIPRDEAVKRLQVRNNLTSDQALARINNQPSNLVYVNASNVVFSSLWEKEYTKQQVDKAWDLLQLRIQ